jgi:hypothetical protein
MCASYGIMMRPKVFTTVMTVESVGEAEASAETSSTAQYESLESLAIKADFPDLSSLSLHFHSRHTSLYRAVNRLRLSHLWGIHVLIAQDRDLHAMRAQHPSDLLQKTHGIVIQVSHLQPQPHQHGLVIPEPRSRHRSPAHASAIPGHPSLD